MKTKLLFLLFTVLLCSGLISCGASSNVAPQPPELTVDVDNVSFGETFIGETSEAQNITISNKFTKTIPSVILSLSDGFVRDMDNTTCPSGIIRFTPNYSCNLAVKFLPNRRDNITGILSYQTDNSSKRLAKLIGLGRNSLPLVVDNSSEISYWNIPLGAKKMRYVTIRNNIEDIQGNFQDIYLSYNDVESDTAVVTYDIDNSNSTCFNGMILGFGESCYIALSATAKLQTSGKHTGSFIVSSDYQTYKYKLSAETVNNNVATVYSYPKSRIYPGIAVVNNKLYLYGGIKDNKTFENSLWSFDLTAPKIGEEINGAWKLINSSPTNPAIINAKPVVVGNKILIVGGRLPDGSTNNTALSIDTTNNAITPLNNSYKATEYGIAVTSTNDIYAFGGYDNTTFPTVYASLLQSLRKINSTNGSMTTVADNVDTVDFPTPVGRVGNALSSVNIGGKEYLYLYGGKLYDAITNTTSITGELWRYYIDNNEWKKLTISGDAPNPIERIYSHMEYIGGKLFFYGGEKGNTTYYDFHEMTPSETDPQQFSSIKNILVDPRNQKIELKYPGVTASGNKLYFYGGIDNISKQPSDKLYIYDINTKMVTGTTLQIPYQLKDHTIGGYIDNKSIVNIYVIGGKDNMLENKIYFFSYNTATGLYEDLKSRNPPVTPLTDNATLTQLGRYLFFTNADGVASGFFRYSPETTLWASELNSIQGTDTASGRRSHSAVNYRHNKLDALYIFGGIVNNMYTNSMDIVTLDSKKNDAVKVMTSNALTPPPARANHSMIEVNGDIYLYGGNDATQIFSDLWVFEVTSPSTGEGIWSKLADLSPALKRKNHKLMVNSTKDKLYIVGGISDNGDESGIKAISLSKTMPITVLPDPTITGDSLNNISGKVYFENIDGTAVGVEGNRITFINF